MSTAKVVLVINPNTSEDMTKSIDESAQSVASGFRVITRRAEMGPESIEGPLDRALCIPGMVEAALNEEEAFHAIVSACFGDPGVDVLQGLFDIPVVGIAESSFFVASRTGGRFSILATRAESIPFLSDLVHRRGFGEKLCSIRAAGMAVLDTEKRSDEVKTKILTAARELIEEGSDMLILGCAGLGKHADLINQETGVCCVDPVKAGVQMAGIATQYWNKNSRSLRPRPDRKKLMGYSSLQRLYKGS